MKPIINQALRVLLRRAGMPDRPGKILGPERVRVHGVGDAADRGRNERGDLPVRDLPPVRSPVGRRGRSVGTGRVRPGPPRPGLRAPRPLLRGDSPFQQHGTTWSSTRASPDWPSRPLRARWNSPCRPEWPGTCRKKPETITGVTSTPLRPAPPPPPGPATTTWPRPTRRRPTPSSSPTRCWPAGSRSASYPVCSGIPRILSHDPETTVSVGVTGQLYLDHMWSLFGEWIFSQPREDQEYDSGSFGVQIGTGGHFFKLLITNQHQMNPTQTLAGRRKIFLMRGRGGSGSISSEGLEGCRIRSEGGGGSGGRIVAGLAVPPRESEQAEILRGVSLQVAAPGHAGLGGTERAAGGVDGVID